MVEASSIDIEKVQHTKLKEVDFENLAFGRVFSDHMLVADYRNGKWEAVKIEPYSPMSIPPAMASLQYGQLIFEGLKAYRDVNGQINLFRADENWKRFNRSAQRLVMPEVPEEIFMGGIKQLIDLDREWVSDKQGYSLYLRPFMFSTDEVVKVRPSDTYRFIVFTSPVGVYYSDPIKAKIEKHYIRSAPGGVGFAKCAGNYAQALYPTKMAQEEGYHQILWTDAKTHEYFEESGTMNIMFVLNGKIVTPPTSDTILPGITRKSLIHLARELGYEVEERPVKVKEIVDALENGQLEEAFGCGTAVTVGHVSLIGYEGKDYELPPIENRKIAKHLAQKLDDIKLGKKPAPEGWIQKI